MSEQDHRVAVITGASQGIGAGLVAGYRRRGWAVVATSRAIKAAGDPAVLTIAGDISDPATTDRLISGALERFGRIDTLTTRAPAATPLRVWRSDEVTPLSPHPNDPARQAGSPSPAGQP